MTAEERMAYFQGEKHRNTNYQTKKSEKNGTAIFLKLKFMIALVIFVMFLSLDYTGYKIQGIGSQEIIQQVVTDMDFLKLVEKYTL